MYVRVYMLYVRLPTILSAANININVREIVLLVVVVVVVLFFLFMLPSLGQM